MWKGRTKDARAAVPAQEGDWRRSRAILRDVLKVWQTNSRIANIDQFERQGCPKSSWGAEWLGSQASVEAEWAEVHEGAEPSAPVKVWGMHGWIGPKRKWPYQANRQIESKRNWRLRKAARRLEKWKPGFERSHQRHQEGEIDACQCTKPESSSIELGKIGNARVFVRVKLQSGLWKWSAARRARSSDRALPERRSKCCWCCLSIWPSGRRAGEI